MLQRALIAQSRRGSRTITRALQSHVVGRELECTVIRAGSSVPGRALLETDELIFRGEGQRLRIPYATVTSARAEGGVLDLGHGGETTSFELGREAERWAHRILHPKTVVEKLGVRPGQRVAIHGVEDAAFLRDLETAGAQRAADRADHLFVAVDSRADLDALPGLIGLIARDGAVWTIRPKGRAEVTESDVRSAGRAAGLVDVKVVRFSPSHTAEKFVIPVAAR
jgi:hypothetical protein